MRLNDKYSATPATPSARERVEPTRETATNVIRGEIDALYGKSRAPSGSQTASSVAQSDQWRAYHEAWQQYYQKYYEQHYTGHLRRILTEQQRAMAEAMAGANAHEGATLVSSKQLQPVEELREKLRQTVIDNARKARKSRHFIPAVAAFAVVFVFGFLQYNSLLMANVQAYVSPGAINPQNIVVDPNVSPKVGPEPRLIIPKINVDVPVIYGVATDHASQMAAMEKGVAHFAIPGASSVPGQVGNTALSGHSSNDLFEPGDYKFIFAQLDKLVNGDTIYVNYQGTRYTYTVTKQEVVGPNDGQKLIYATTKPMLTLITCTPLGTSTNRLLVTAEQVSPDPAKAAAASSPATGSKPGGIPGSSSSALQKLFGG